MTNNAAISAGDSGIPPIGHLFMKPRPPAVRRWEALPIQRGRRWINPRACFRAGLAGTRALNLLFVWSGYSRGQVDRHKNRRRNQDASRAERAHRWLRRSAATGQWLAKTLRAYTFASAVRPPWGAFLRPPPLGVERHSTFDIWSTNSSGYSCTITKGARSAATRRISPDGLLVRPASW